MDARVIKEAEELFKLDPESGKLYWKVRSARRVKIGDEAGTKNCNGYRQVYILGRLYRSHRVVFAIIHGRWPESELDHINGIRDDNRPSNLREATPSQNSMNTGMSGMNKSGIRGVSWSKVCNKWRASIQVRRKQIHLGVFNSISDAEVAYNAAASKYFGEFQGNMRVMK